MLQKADTEVGTEGIWKDQNKEYDIKVDPKQEYRASEIKLLSCSRPHSRAFHCSWIAWVVGFSVWFAIVPLLSEIQKTIPSITKRDLWTSNIMSVSGTILVRFCLGPACDKYGARILFTFLLCLSAIPSALTGIIQSANDLIVLRLFIGIAGGGFVLCQFWSSCMFTKEVVGTANAYVAGWGNVGGGLTQLLIGSILFPFFKTLFDNDGIRTTAQVSELAWRTVSIVPATTAVITGIIIYFVSDDTPQGNYIELKKQKTSTSSTDMTTTFWVGVNNRNTWILFFQYFCCFGVELTMNNAAALYFHERFGQNTENAAAIASIFGWMNLFARALGGTLSDFMNTKMGMKGRIIVLTFCLIMEGLLVFVFANTTNLIGSIVSMIFLSIFVTAAGGATFGIVPYIDPTGTVSGIVGAGGNAGAICFGLAFRELHQHYYQSAFSIMGTAILVSAVLSFFTNIQGQSTLLSNSRKKSVKIQIDQEDNSSTVQQRLCNICSLRAFTIGTLLSTILILSCYVLYQLYLENKSLLMN